MIPRQIDFSSNLNPLGPPKRALEKVNLGNIISRYPENQSLEAVNSVSRFCSIPLDNLAIGAGSTEFFFTIPGTLGLDQGVVVVPTFWEYETSLRLNGMKVERVYTRGSEGFRLDFEEIRRILKAVPRKTKTALYLCNPNNPTSVLSDSKKILELCDEFPDVSTIVDETYLMFRRDYTSRSLMSEATKRKNLSVLLSLSKFFAVPGARIGICCSGGENIHSIQARQIPYGVSTFAQAVIPALLDDEEFISESREFIEKERRRVYGEVRNSQFLSVNFPEANFILARVNGKSADSVPLVDYLKRNGISVRAGIEFEGLGKEYIRFSIRRKEENDLLIKRVNDYFRSMTRPS